MGFCDFTVFSAGDSAGMKSSDNDRANAEGADMSLAAVPRARHAGPTPYESQHRSGLPAA